MSLWVDCVFVGFWVCGFVGFCDICLGFREIGEGEEVLSTPKALPRTPPPPGSISSWCHQLTRHLHLRFDNQHNIDQQLSQLKVAGTVNHP